MSDILSVRTGKRNWRGMLNDGLNSISRMYANTVIDFFRQACIDYILGVNLNAFHEFQQTLVAKDPGELLRLSTIRATAIETAASDVLADETRIDGWTLLSPQVDGQLTAPSYEERVVLLTRTALYICSYEYQLQKVRDFLRVPLGSILEITYGSYILSTLSSFARDSRENQGLVVRFDAAHASGRSRQYSIKNKLAEPDAKESEKAATDAFVAFKLMRKDLARTTPAAQTSAEHDIKQLVDRLARAVEDAGAGHDGLIKAAPIVRCVVTR